MERRTAREDALIALKCILKEAPQDAWYTVASRAEPVRDADLLIWMLQQPECDFGVAAYLLYAADTVAPICSGAHLSDPVAVTILENWQRGYYQRHEIDVAAEAEPSARILREFYASTPADQRQVLVPARFRRPAGGRPVSVPYCFSPEHDAHFWTICRAAGLRVPERKPGLGWIADEVAMAVTMGIAGLRMLMAQSGVSGGAATMGFGGENRAMLMLVVGLFLITITQAFFLLQGSGIPDFDLPAGLAHTLANVCGN